MKSSMHVVAEPREVMFIDWRLKLLSAGRAIDEGRLTDAAATLLLPELRDYKQTRELAAKLAAKLGELAGEQLALGDTRQGWHNLELAEQLAPGQQVALRNQQTDRVTIEAWRLAAAGELAAARRLVARNRSRGLSRELLQRLDDLLQAAGESDRAAAEGDFADARAMHHRLQHAAEGVRQQCPQLELDTQWVAGRGTTLEARSAEHANHCARLHAALAAEEWREVLAAASDVLRVAPRDRHARRARGRAWQAAGLAATQPHFGSPAVVEAPLRTDPAIATPPAAVAPIGERLVLWIDAVGGYLVTTSSRVVFGPPIGATGDTIAIQADLSRQHATLRRDGGDYVLEPAGRVLLDGHEITKPVVLGSRHKITLGTGVVLEFVRPHALSATARLNMTSHHRFQPRVDGVLLMAESCLLGSKAHSHIRCADWPGDLLLYRGRDGLEARCTMPLAGQDVAPREPLAVRPGGRWEGEAFSLSVETG